MASRTAYVGTQSPGQALTSANFTKLPGGCIAYVTATSDEAGVGTGGTNLAGLSVTITTAGSRLLLLESRVRVTTASTALNAFLLLEISGSTDLDIVSGNLNSGGQITLANKVLLAPSAGSVTYRLNLSTSTGTVTAAAGATFPNMLMITDVGPSF